MHQKPSHRASAPEVPQRLKPPLAPALIAALKSGSTQNQRPAQAELGRGTLVTLDLAEVADQDYVGGSVAFGHEELFSVARPGEGVDAIGGEVCDLVRWAAG